MEYKICKKCGRELPTSHFTKESRQKDGLFIWCKDCEKEYNEEYAKSLRGSSVKLWHAYVVADREKGRIGDVLPNDYIDIEWIMEQRLKGCAHQTKCGTTDWREVGLNRIDNSLPHLKSNCEPCCFKCNRELQDNAGSARRVDQIDSISGEVIASYSKIKDAAEAINGSHGHICSCCQGKRKTHKSFTWKYVLI